MKKHVKFGIDVVLTVLLLLLMTFERVGGAVHEWLGIFLFVLTVLHHVLNRSWSRNVLRGKHTPLRVLQTLLVALLLCAMAGSMVSGVVLSRHVLPFLKIHNETGWVQRLHMLCAYWGFVLMGFHLGLHWGIMLGIFGKRLNRSVLGGWLCRIAGLLFALYGGYAFVKRDLPDYMLLKSHFVLFDFSEPLALFLLDYLAVFGAFVWLGYYLAKAVKRRKHGER